MRSFGDRVWEETRLANPLIGEMNSQVIRREREEVLMSAVTHLP